MDGMIHKQNCRFELSYGCTKVEPIVVSVTLT